MHSLSTIAIAAALALGAVGVAAAEEPQYLGEFCWLAESNSVDDPEVATFRLGILSIDGKHFPVYGMVAGDEGSLVLTGNAQMTAEGIEASLHGSGTTIMFRQITTVHMTLESTLDGYYRALGFESMGGETPEPLTDEGTLTLIDCPK